MAEWDAEELARLRQGLYQFFSASHLYPERDRLALLIDASTLLDSQRLAEFSFYDTWERLRGDLQGNVSLRELEREYVRLFSVGPGGALCPPHESFYLAPPGQATAVVIIQVEREYARLGLTIPPDYKGLPDHASVEMAAMALLCQREGEAWRVGAAGDADEVLQDERSFLRGHLSRWFPTFASRVAKARIGALCSSAVAAADAFIKHDLDLLDLMVKEVSS